jgi:hypothetical protein
MTNGTVVLAGSLPVEHLQLDALAAEFGWSLQEAASLRGVSELNADHNLVAVFFDARSLALSWDRALRGVREAAPGALPILCPQFADAIDWPQVAEAGGFHSLPLPFAKHEIRQSLGFVWEAKSRLAVIPIRAHSVVHEEVLQERTWAAGNVA